MLTSRTQTRNACRPSQCNRK